MITKKIFFFKKNVVFREKRNYLHSTDIFNQIINLKKKSKIKSLEINFKKKITRTPYCIFHKGNYENIGKKSYANFEFKDKNQKFVGYIFQTQNKIVKKRKYNEEYLQKKVIISNKNLFIPKDIRFNFIEKITSSAMKYLNLQKISTDKSKWYLVNLKINNFFQHKKKIQIRIKPNKKNDRIYLFYIYMGKKIGQMLFLRK